MINVKSRHFNDWMSELMNSLCVVLCCVVISSVSALRRRRLWFCSQLWGLDPHRPAPLSSEGPDRLALSPPAAPGFSGPLLREGPPYWAERPCILSTQCNSVCTAGRSCLYYSSSSTRQTRRRENLLGAQRSVSFCSYLQTQIITYSSSSVQEMQSDVHQSVVKKKMIWEDGAGAAELKVLACTIKRHHVDQWFNTWG